MPRDTTLCTMVVDWRPLQVTPRRLQSHVRRFEPRRRSHQRAPPARPHRDGETAGRSIGNVCCRNEWGPAQQAPSTLTETRPTTPRRQHNRPGSLKIPSRRWKGRESVLLFQWCPQLRPRPWVGRHRALAADDRRPHIRPFPRPPRRPLLRDGPHPRRKPKNLPPRRRLHRQKHQAPADPAHLRPMFRRCRPFDLDLASNIPSSGDHRRRVHTQTLLSASRSAVLVG